MRYHFLLAAIVLCSVATASAEYQFGACCSANGGVCGCKGGGTVCCDGKESTCPCDPKDFKISVPAPAAPAAKVEPSKQPAPQGHAKYLPDKNLTPGDVRSRDKGQICAAGYIQSVGRTSQTMRDQIYERYKITRRSGHEIDHLISKGLGGSKDIKNLYPQPRSGPWNMAQKDQLENLLHRQVCAGKVPLETAQREIAADWISAYKKYVGTPGPKVPSRSKSAAPKKITKKP